MTWWKGGWCKTFELHWSKRWLPCMLGRITSCRILRLAYPGVTDTYNQWGHGLLLATNPKGWLDEWVPYRPTTLFESPSYPQLVSLTWGLHECLGGTIPVPELGLGSTAPAHRLLHLAEVWAGARRGHGSARAAWRLDNSSDQCCATLLDIHTWENGSSWREWILCMPSSVWRS